VKSFGSCARGQRDNLRHRLQAFRIGNALAGDHHGGGAVGNRAGGGGRDRAVLGEGGLERRNLVRAALAGLFVGIDHDIAAARLHGDRRDFVHEGALPKSRLRAAQRSIV
jgi:hypothetical protein